MGRWPAWAASVTPRASPVILTAIRDAAPPTLLVGMDALRALPGEDVTRALIDAYPRLPSRAQLALIPVLGARRDPMALPMLEQLTRSNQPETRLAALEAMGDSDLPQAIEFLSAEAKQQRCDPAGEGSRDHRAAQAQGNRELASAVLPRVHTTPISWRCWESSAAGGLSDRSTSARKTRDGRRRYIGEPDVNVVARVHVRQDSKAVETRGVSGLSGQDRPPRDDRRPR